MTSGVYDNCVLNPDLFETRLLEIQPALLSSSPIRVRLLKAFVVDPPVYYALSYVWGTSVGTVPIFVNGKRFGVTKNLFAALKRLRRRTFSFLLWVDAICINQANIPERNFQVRLMKDIYSGAERVLIWLGESEDESDLAMDLIKAWSPPDTEKLNVAQFLERVPQGFNLRAWHAARRLFARNYWKRAWIFQEIVFSKKATVLCGSKHVSWEQLGRAQVIWQQLKSEPENFHLLKPEQLNMIQLTFFDTVASISLHHLLQRFEESRDLFQLLDSTARFHATDSRDKIYALLGFSEVAVLDLEPDYLIPLERVYGEFVQACIEVERKLSVLFMTGIGHRRAEPFIDLPSWVPDFRGSAYNLRANQFTLSHFHAAGDTSAIVTISEDVRTLAAKGYVWDVITDLDSGRSEEHKRIRNRWLDLAVGQSKVHPTGIPHLQAYFRTIIADDTGLGYGKPGFRNEESQSFFFTAAAGMMYLLGEMTLKQDQSAFQALLDPQIVQDMLLEPDYVQNFFIWDQKIPVPLTKQRLLAPFLGNSESDPGSEILWPEEDDKMLGYKGSRIYLEREAFNCTSRSFFLTEKGYMGLGPRGAKKGDNICVLLGCDMPLIIRQVGEHYAVVGNTYIYGMMNGEVLQDVRDSKEELQDIVFR